MSDFNEMNAGPKWYVAHTYSGYENKVKTNLEKIIENRGLGHLIFEIRIPTEIVVEYDEGVEKETEQKVFPSYVLIKMIMSDESWHVVRNIRGVTGFVGPGSKPVPLTDEEVEAILNVETEKAPSAKFSVGDTVDIIDGMFNGFFGQISEISEDGESVTVIVQTVGNDMPVTVETKQIKKK